MARIPINSRTPNSRTPPPQRRRHQHYLKADIILRYLLQTDDSVDTLIKCNPGNCRLVTTDQSLYEALGAVKDYDNVNLRNLVKFLEVVDVVSFKEKMSKPRKILTDSRVELLRKAALAAGNKKQR